MKDYEVTKPPMTEEWVESLADQFAGCDLPEQLFNASADLFAFRLAKDTYVEGVRLWRLRMRQLSPGISSKSIMAIDLPAIHHAAHAVCKDKDGVPELCVKMIKNLRSETKPDILIVATDCRSGIDKFKRFPQYKGDRGDRKIGFDESLTNSIDAIDCTTTKVCEIDGMEADDILCSASYRARLAGQEIVIVANDRDLWQAFGRGAAMMHPSTKSFTNEKWLMEKHLLRPDQVPDWMCMVGKNNIPGADGVGPETASKWLQAWDSFCGIMTMTHELTEKKRTSMTELASRYWDVVKLHTLSREAGVVWS